MRHTPPLPIALHPWQARRRLLFSLLALAAALLLLLGGAGKAEGATKGAPGLAGVPVPDHVVVVVEENHSFNDIIGNANAPYINALAASGALFTNSHGVEHPSQPNYLDLFSGSRQTAVQDECPPTGTPYSADNLGAQLLGHGYTFTGYSEDLPAVGSTVCQSGQYYRKHNPWSYFANIPPTTNQPFAAWPADFASLPTVSFVVPNQDHDMHDGTIAQADTWLQAHLGTYVQWAQGHNSLLILTWDEDDYSSSNAIPTIFKGPMVSSGQYGELITHFSVLRTLEDMYGLGYAGASAGVQPITDVWTSSPTATHTSTSTPTAAATSTPTASPTSTATTCSVSFSDVSQGSTFYDYVRCLACKGIIAGYSDGTFRPGNSITRQAIAKIVFLSAGFSEDSGPRIFADVDSSSPDYVKIQAMARRNVISGYQCGATNEPCDEAHRPYFRPGSNATRGQLAKIVAEAAGLTQDPPQGTQTYADVPPGNPFYKYIEALSARGAVSGYACGNRASEACDDRQRPYFRYGDHVTRGQATKIVAGTFFPAVSSMPTK